MNTPHTCSHKVFKLKRKERSQVSVPMAGVLYLQRMLSIYGKTGNLATSRKVFTTNVACIYKQQLFSERAVCVYLTVT